MPQSALHEQRALPYPCLHCRSYYDLEAGYDVLEVLSSNQTQLLSVSGNVLLQPSAPRYMALHGGAGGATFYVAFSSDTYVEDTGFLLRQAYS